MKAVSIRQAHDAFSACIKESQSEPLVITHRGRAVAVIVGVEDLDPEVVALGADPRVWAFVERRRKGRHVSHEEALRRLGLK